MHQREETIQFFKSWKARIAAGNVEIQLSENADDCGCDFTKDHVVMIFRNCGTLLKANYLLLLYHTLELPEFITFDYANKKNNSCSWFLFQHL
jgi:hypothetical protein